MKELGNYIRDKIEVSGEELNTILSFFKPLKLRKNDLSVVHGQTSPRIFFVCKGCLRIYFINKEEQEATRYFAFENEFATNLLGFITEEPSKETIQAVEDTELLFITHTDRNYSGCRRHRITFYHPYRLLSSARYNSAMGKVFTAATWKLLSA